LGQATAGRLSGSSLEPVLGLAPGEETGGQEVGTGGQALSPFCASSGRLSTRSFGGHVAQLLEPVPSGTTDVNDDGVGGVELSGFASEPGPGQEALLAASGLA